MANLELRAAKGSALTHGEVDGNFTALNDELGFGVINVKAAPYNAVGDGSDDTAAIQAAIDAAYAQGGGTVFIPAGTYGVTSISRVWSGNVSISIRGEGKAASVLQKIGATTTPVLNFNGGGSLRDISLLMSDFGVWGNVNGLKEHNGIDLTLLARMELQRLSIFACNVGLSVVGSLVFGVRECSINANNIGYRSRLSGIIRANLVNFYGGTINSNSTYGVDLGDCAGVNFWGTDFEGNGTAASLVTGAVNILATVDDEFGQSNISFNNCWFESNNGMTIECAAATGLDLTFRTCFLIGAEGGNVANVGAIKHLILENVVAGEVNATITSNAIRTFILGGVLHTYVDNSITTKINFQDVNGTSRLVTPSVIATGGGGVSAQGEITNLGQSGPFGFIACSTAGVARVGGFNYGTDLRVPLNLFTTMVQMPTATTADLSAVANAINTDGGKIQGTMVFDTTANIPMYATGSADDSTWVGEKAGVTITLTPV